MITIIGAGALGSHVAMALRNFKQKVRVIDFDRIEQKNVMSQFHTRMGLSKNKAQALSQAMKGMFGTTIEAVPHKLTADNWSQLLMDAEVIIDCTDNIAARKLIQEYYDEYGVPCIHGALAADGTFARVVWDHLFQPDEETGDGATCEDGEHLPFFMMASALLARSVQEFFNSGRKLSFQLTPKSVTQI